MPCGFRRALTFSQNFFHPVSDTNQMKISKILTGFERMLKIRKHSIGYRRAPGAPPLIFRVKTV